MAQIVPREIRLRSTRLDDGNQPTADVPSAIFCPDSRTSLMVMALPPRYVPHSVPQLRAPPHPSRVMIPCNYPSRKLVNRALVSPSDLPEQKREGSWMRGRWPGMPAWSCYQRLGTSERHGATVGVRGRDCAPERRTPPTNHRMA